MIPRIIHYCWFGKGPMPALAEDCIASWRRLCPDYEIVQWNEENFDVNQIVFVKEAYDVKMYAFVADFVRLHALYTMGGIYMDIDVELKKSPDALLNNEVFIGFESKDKLSSAVIGAVPQSETVKKLLDYYKGRHFVLPDGTRDTTTNVEIITDIIAEMGLIADDSYQKVGNIAVYPHFVLCPVLSRISDESYMRDTVAVHHFMGSWKSERAKKRESSRIFRILTYPIRLLSRLLTALFGKRWTKLKNRLRAKIFRD